MKELLKNRTNLIIFAVITFLLIGGFFAYQKFVAGSNQNIVEEDLIFDPEGPYAILYPRRDGNALVLNIKRTASYDQIRYEISYNSEGVDRGAQGDINTGDRKGEYEQEILFGSCSTGGTCVYDKGVENGTLILHIRKGNKAYRMTTQWHLQKPDLTLGNLTSGDGHLIYKISGPADTLSIVKFTIINDLTGAPKLPEGKQVLGKVYSLNTPQAKDLPAGAVSIELAENPPEGSKIARFDEGGNKWVEYETKIEGSKLSAPAERGGIFTVLTSKK